MPFWENKRKKRNNHSPNMDNALNFYMYQCKKKSEINSWKSVLSAVCFHSFIAIIDVRWKSTDSPSNRLFVFFSTPKEVNFFHLSKETTHFRYELIAAMITQHCYTFRHLKLASECNSAVITRQWKFSSNQKLIVIKMLSCIKPLELNRFYDSLVFIVCTNNIKSSPNWF